MYLLFGFVFLPATIWALKRKRGKDSSNSDTFTQLQMLIFKTKQIRGGGSEIRMKPQ